MRVLIVDDEPAARARLRRLLAAEAGISAVHEAEDAPSALATVAQLGAFDLAVLDIEMPGGSGLQLAAQLPPATCSCRSGTSRRRAAKHCAATMAPSR